MHYFLTLLCIHRFIIFTMVQIPLYKFSFHEEIISYENFIERDIVIKKLAKRLIELYDEIINHPRVKLIAMEMELDTETKNLELKNGERFFVKKKTVILNAANPEFRPTFHGDNLNSSLSRFLNGMGGIEKLNWKGLTKLRKSTYTKRMRISYFNYGWVFHLLGIKADELQELGLSLEEFEEYLFNLYLKCFEEIIKLVPNGNVMVFFISTHEFAFDSIDNLQVEFTEKEFILRAKLACYRAIKRYKDRLNFILNAYY